MAREITAKMVEEMANRLADVDKNISELDGHIEEARQLDRRSGQYRAAAILIGVPTALAAFVLFTFYRNTFGGQGVYIGLGLSAIALVASRLGLAQPSSVVPTLDHQRTILMAQRDKLQGQIQTYVDQNPESTAEATG